MTVDGAGVTPDVWHAFENGGGFIVDTGLNFRRSLTRRGLTYWDSLRGGLDAPPPKSALDPSHIVPLLPNVVLADIIRDGDGNRDYLIRLMGTRVADMFGDGTGKRLSEGLNGPELTRARAAMEQVASSEAPARLTSVSAYHNGQWMNAEGFYAPLLSGEGGLDHLFVVVDVWPRTEPAAEIGRPPGAEEDPDA